MRDKSLLAEKPSDKINIKGWYLTFFVHKFHRKRHNFSIFGEISVESICLKIGFYSKNPDVFRDIPFFLGYPSKKILSKDDFWRLSSTNSTKLSYFRPFWRSISWNSMLKNRSFNKKARCFRGYTVIPGRLRWQIYYQGMISDHFRL